MYSWETSARDVYFGDIAATCIATFFKHFWFHRLLRLPLLRSEHRYVRRRGYNLQHIRLLRSFQIFWCSGFLRLLLLFNKSIFYSLCCISCPSFCHECIHICCIRICNLIHNCIYKSLELFVLSYEVCLRVYFYNCCYFVVFNNSFYDTFCRNSSSFFSAFACPFFLKNSIAASISPFVSFRAFCSPSFLHLSSLLTLYHACCDCHDFSSMNWNSLPKMLQPDVQAEAFTFIIILLLQSLQLLLLQLPHNMHLLLLPDLLR